MLETDDAVLTQFNRLIDELLRGNLKRSKFWPWEIEILVDMVSCDLPGTSQRVNILREYQNAVQRRIKDGARFPLKLSEYLELQGKSSRSAGARPSRRAGFPRPAVAECVALGPGRAAADEKTYG
jgi:hypothetical protein